MSPDDVLAANLWIWPDPLIKRDRAGRVMFVNAAFLGLYGGRVQDWQGNVVTGWPSPSAQGAQRFETRVGEGTSQTIYDWVEMPMADGNALAIARDVTQFVATPPPAVPAPEPEIDTPVEEPIQNVSAQPAPEDIAPTLPSAPPAPEPAPEPQPVAQTPPSEQAQENQPEAEPEQVLEPAQVETPESTPTPTTELTPEPEERMIERRALPIEDSTSVLGANWRDQVIAKATGAEIEDEQDDAHTNTNKGMGQTPTVEEENAGGKVASGLQILLAEDNAINALLTRTLLEAEGAEVDTVEDGALAVQAVKEKQYDLIFMDMRMPNMDGLESTRKIRAYGATLPIIALTANAFDDDRNACFDSGMNDFMTKPVSAEELIEMVTEWTKKDKAA